MGGIKIYILPTESNLSIVTLTAIRRYDEALQQSVKMIDLKSGLKAHGITPDGHFASKPTGSRILFRRQGAQLLLGKIALLLLEYIRYYRSTN